MITFSRTLVSLASLLLLAGCMLVEDFGDAWKKGKTDSCVNKIAEALYYSDFRRDPSDKDMDDHARVFTIDGFHFLMLKKDPSDTGGRMYRFRVFNGIFQRYRLDPVMRDAFEIAYPDAPVSLRNDTVSFVTLGEKEIALMKEIAAQDDYWEIEDQTLYNTMRNRSCAYDDRDLAALEAAEKGNRKP